MVRDSKGRFAKANKDDDLIRRMDLNLNKKGGREVPVVDKRNTTVTIPIAKFEESENGRIYKFDEKLIKKAIKNINKLGLGSIEHPVKRNDFFNKIGAECTKRDKKTDSELIRTLCDNVSNYSVEKAEEDDKERNTLFANSKPISIYANKFGDINMFARPIVEFNRDYAISITDDYFLRVNIKGHIYPSIIDFFKEIKSFDYFTVNFMWYDDDGFQTGRKTFDGYKFVDLTYNSEKNIYTLTLIKNNI